MVGKYLPSPVKRVLAPWREAWLLMRRRPRGWRQFLLSGVSEGFGASRSWGRPVSVTLEPANVCNLRCPVCETGSGTLDRPSGLMTYAQFVTIIDKVAPTANHLMFYFMGEPFLNPDAYRMIRYARGLGLHVATCTNGERIDPVALYESGVSQVSFQIGGVSQDSHAVYRRGGDLALTLEKLRAYLCLIRERGRADGENRVSLGLIVMRHNETEIDAFQRLGEDLGVDGTNLVSPCVRTAHQARAFLPADERYWLYDPEALRREGRLVPVRCVPENVCPWLYYALTVQVDGTVVPCCCDARGNHPMGNLLQQDLDAVWNGPAFRAFRRDVRDRHTRVPVCDLCRGYGPPALRDTGVSDRAPATDGSE